MMMMMTTQAGLTLGYSTRSSPAIDAAASELATPIIGRKQMLGSHWLAHLASQRCNEESQFISQSTEQQYQLIERVYKRVTKLASEQRVDLNGFQIKSLGTNIQRFTRFYYQTRRV